MIRRAYLFLSAGFMPTARRPHTGHAFARSFKLSYIELDVHGWVVEQAIDEAEQRR